MHQDPPAVFETRPATLADAEAIAELINEASLERTGRPQTTARYVLGAMQTPGINLGIDSLLAF
jgi:hypothetical protein